MKTLCAIAGVDVLLLETGALFFISSAMIDADGAGSSHGDPFFQNDTSLHQNGKPLTSDIDRFIVLPPQVIKGVAPIVLGCRAFVVNVKTGLYTEAVVGDIGPHNKIGEMSIACSEALGVPSSPTVGGEEAHVLLYTIWPGKPANVNGKFYTLQHA